MGTRVAVLVPGELGVRASRALLAEPGVLIGLFDEEPTTQRVERVNRVDEWDVLVVDEVSFATRNRIDEAIDASVAVVIGAEVHGLDAPESPVVAGLLEGPGLAAALARLLPEGSVEMGIRLAWTEEGHPLDAGVAVGFPEPVGPLWAEPRTLIDPARQALVAPTNRRWRAAVATGGSDGSTQTVGVADDRKFLDALVLTAAALAAGDGAYPDGVVGPGAAGETFIEHARRAGLEVASFSTDGE